MLGPFTGSLVRGMACWVGRVSLGKAWHAITLHAHLWKYVPATQKHCVHCLMCYIRPLPKELMFCLHFAGELWRRLRAQLEHPRLGERLGAAAGQALGIWLVAMERMESKGTAGGGGGGGSDSGRGGRGVAPLTVFKVGVLAAALVKSTAISLAWCWVVHAVPSALCSSHFHSRPPYEKHIIVRFQVFAVLGLTGDQAV